MKDAAAFKYTGMVGCVLWLGNCSGRRSVFYDDTERLYGDGRSDGQQ